MATLACYSKHKKPVCDRCDAGTNCTKCCPCTPRVVGRPRKDSGSNEPHRVNPEREVKVPRLRDSDATAEMAVATVEDEADLYRLHAVHTHNMNRCKRTSSK